MYRDSKTSHSAKPNAAKPTPQTTLKSTNSTLPRKPSRGKPVSSSSRKEIKPAPQAKTVSRKEEKPPIPIQKSSGKVEKQRRPLYDKAKINSKMQGQVKGKGNGWNNLPLNLLLQISGFACKSGLQVYRLSLACSTWRQLMQVENGVYFWQHLKGFQQAGHFYQFLKCLQSELNEVRQKRSTEFEAMFTKLFNYGSTKQNIANKLINRLKLEMEVSLNGKVIRPYAFKLRQFNFGSYLHSKVTQVASLPFDLYSPHNMFKDKLNIAITFYSRTFKVKHSLNYKLTPEEVADCAIKQKAYNYFLAKNIAITFFEGDSCFLYCFLEMSALQLVTEFRSIIRRNHQEHLQKHAKKLPMYKRLCENEWGDFEEYIRFQADFEMHMSYHNSVQQIFSHADTKVYPKQYDRKHAYFEVTIDDSFPKGPTFLLDNKMGISEPVPDLFLLDFVLKDRDRFLVVHSGFIYARDATQKERESVEDYFKFAERPMKILHFKQPRCECSILVIEQGKRNMIKHARFSLFP